MKPTVEKGRTEREFLKNRKIARTLISLKHSLNRDEELWDTMPKVDKKFIGKTLKSIKAVAPEASKIIDGVGKLVNG